MGELVERGLQVFDNFGGKNGWIRQIVCVFEAFVAEPGDIEAQLVAFLQILITEATEAFGCLALVAVLHVIAGDEVIEIGAFERVCFEREVLVGA